MNTGSGHLMTPVPQPYARRRLVTFPHVGGEAGFYRAWPEALGPDVAVCVGVQ